MRAKSKRLTVAWVRPLWATRGAGAVVKRGPVAEVNDTATEAVFVQEFVLDANVVRQCGLIAARAHGLPVHHLLVYPRDAIAE